MRYVNNYMTIASNSLSFHFQKHPHLRGENQQSGNPDKDYLETSPPAWGKRYYYSASPFIGGNIPTCVGKTWTYAAGRELPGKHPHLRGENRRRISLRLIAPETSPPAWGKHCVVDVLAFRSRNIPTCVGKTGGDIARSPSRWKHPHLRGENQTKSTRANRF